MAGKTEAYRTVIAHTEVRVYERELRKLLRLPLRKGRIESAEFSTGRLEVKFVQTNGKQFHI